MEIQVVATAEAIPRNPAGRPVVIDVLRATSTIVMALEAGASEIVPVEEADDARRWRGKALLAGEIDASRIADFDLGNSPLEFSAERVAGKRVVLRTRNGTRALLRARAHGPVVCASFLNLSAVVDRLRQSSRILLICSGTDDRFSADDLAVAGALVAGLDAEQVDDLGAVARRWYESQADNLPGLLASTFHGRGLIAKGLAEDVAFCARRDVSSRVPIYDGDAIRG
jgi:2-phosphosulfolactate phosphatase